MTFDKTLPSTTSKIRDYPSILIGNFSGIQEGDLTFKVWQQNFVERNSVPGAPPPNTDPTRDDDTMILFSKQDAVPNTELFVMDDQNPANIIQLTEEGALGSTSTQVNTNGISFDATYINTQDAFCSGWAAVTSTGVLSAGYGLTSAQNGTGDYTLTITTALSSANYVVIGTVLTALTRARVLYCYDRQAGSFSVRTQAINASAGDYENAAFMVSVFGGR